MLTLSKLEVIEEIEQIAACSGVDLDKEIGPSDLPTEEQREVMEQIMEDLHRIPRVALGVYYESMPKNVKKEYEATLEYAHRRAHSLPPGSWVQMERTSYGYIPYLLGVVGPLREGANSVLH